MVYLYMRTNLHHISEGNTKTACFSFDLPPVETCPGSTTLCRKECYAVNLARYKGVKNKYARNYDIVFHPAFVDYMVETIPYGCDFRIHVSGDFFHADYVQKWIEIATKRPDVRFYAYTRSWRIPDIWSQILKLHHLDNVNVNLSVDHETGAPKVFGASVMRWCYLTKFDEAPQWLRPKDIVFRIMHHARSGGHKWKRKKAIERGEDPDVVAPILKRIVGQVCPMEQGRDMPKSFSCKTCSLCVDKPGARNLVGV